MKKIILLLWVILLTQFTLTNADNQCNSDLYKYSWESFYKWDNLIQNWIWWVQEFINSPSGNGNAYIINNSWKYSVYKDDVLLWEYKNASNLTYSPDWKQFAYRINENWLSYVILNGEKSIWYTNEDWFWWNNTRDLIFSKDWKSFVYLSENNWKTFLVLNWKEQEKYTPWIHQDNTFTIINFEFNDSWELVYKIINDKIYYKIIKNWTEISDYKFKNTSEFKNKIISSDWSKTLELLNNTLSDWINKVQYDTIFDFWFLWNSNGTYYTYKTWENIFYYKNTCWNLSSDLSNINSNVIQEVKTNILTEKEVQVVKNVWEKINKMTSIKKEKYKKQLNQYSTKFKEWTKNYEIIKQLLDIIK